MTSYLQCGEGKDLVFLHGYMANKECFSSQIAYFSKFYRITALDFPGFGQSDPLDTAFSVGDYAEWLMAFLDEKKIVFPNVIAHSFGGRVAVKCLSLRENVFDRAVLCGCAGIVPKRTAMYKIKVKTYRLVKKIAPQFAERRFGSEEYRTLSPIMRESYKKIVNEDLRKDAAQIRRPVLFLNGNKDRETPLSQIEIYQSCVEGSKLTVLDGCGHFAFLDDPLAFGLAAEEFFYGT